MPTRSEKWTAARLKRELRTLARSNLWKATTGELPSNQCSAISEWNKSSPFFVVLDKDQAGQVPLTIHEFLHYTLKDVFSGHFDDELEEVVVVALTQYLDQGWLTSHPGVFEWWRKRVNAKLAEDP